MANITVLAGTNGAGKSSIAGAQLRSAGSNYFNPDEATKLIQSGNPQLSHDQCNALAWTQGTRMLRNAIDTSQDFAFETTLGGNTITAMLLEAVQKGHEVRMWYAGLASIDLHIERVAARVRAGGHDIPEAKIRERYTASLRNLVKLLPLLSELSVYDNSATAAPATGRRPLPMLVARTARGKLLDHCGFDKVPTWAKPILAATSEVGAGGRPHLRVVK